MTTPAPISAADREKAKELNEKATPGPWEIDSVKTEGTYGIGDDTHEGFNEYEIVDIGGRQICSTENRDPNLSEVHDEWDEDSHTAWDEPARRDADFIAFCRTAIPAYESRVVELEAALAHREKMGSALLKDALRAEARAEAAEARATAAEEQLASYKRVGIAAVKLGEENRTRATAVEAALRPLLVDVDKFDDVKLPASEYFIRIPLPDLRAARAVLAAPSNKTARRRDEHD